MEARVKAVDSSLLRSPWRQLHAFAVLCSLSGADRPVVPPHCYAARSRIIKQHDSYFPMKTAKCSGSVCWVCLEGPPPAAENSGALQLISTGCGCRGSMGSVHPHCLISAAKQCTKFKDKNEPWRRCQHCEGLFDIRPQ